MSNIKILHLLKKYVYMCVHMSCISVHLSVVIHVCLHLSGCACVYACVCIQVCVCVHACVCVRMSLCSASCVTLFTCPSGKRRTAGQRGHRFSSDRHRRQRDLGDHHSSYQGNGHQYPHSGLTTIGPK